MEMDNYEPGRGDIDIFDWCEPIGKPMYTSASHSKDERAFRRIRILYAEVFNFAFIVVTQVIETKAILSGIHNFAKLSLKAAALGSIQQAFKDRALNALAVIHALFCDLPEAFTNGGILGIHIISNQNQHIPSLP